MVNPSPRQAPTTPGADAHLLERRSICDAVAKVRLEPGERASQVIGAVLRRAVPGEAVVAAGVAGELDLAADLQERHEHLLALADRAPLVGLPMDDQGWRRHTI